MSGKPLREALARRWGVAPEQILLGNGSDEVIAILVAAFGGGRPGAPARVLYPTPTFGEYESIALSHGAVPLPVPLDDRFQLDEPALAETIRRERPALAFFASPNNPTGNRFEPEADDRSARPTGCRGCLRRRAAAAPAASASAARSLAPRRPEPART